jgi:hypothetical protein
VITQSFEDRNNLNEKKCFYWSCFGITLKRAKFLVQRCSFRLSFGHWVFPFL